MYAKLTFSMNQPSDIINKYVSPTNNFSLDSDGDLAF